MEGRMLKQAKLKRQNIDEVDKTKRRVEALKQQARYTHSLGMADEKILRNKSLKELAVIASKQKAATLKKPKLRKATSLEESVITKMVKPPTKKPSPIITTNLPKPKARHGKKDTSSMMREIEGVMKTKESLRPRKH